MPAEIIPFNTKPVVRKCSFCGKANKIKMAATDEEGNETGKYICEVCVKKMGEMVK